MPCHLLEKLLVLGVLWFEADHQLEGRAIDEGVDVDLSHLRDPGLWIQHVCEGNGNHACPLHGDRRVRAAVQEEGGCGFAEAAGIVDVEGDGVRAAKLVSQVLTRDAK